MNKTLPTLILAGLTTLLAGCSGSLSGEYGGEDCLYHLNFTPKGKVYLSASLFGFKTPETEGSYEIIEDRVIVTNSDGEDIMFRKQDGNLVAMMLGSEMVCQKLER